MTTPLATIDLGVRLSRLECCPVPEFELCILAGGEGYLTLVVADTADASMALRRLDTLSLVHEGSLDAVAWGHEPAAGELRLATVGGTVSSPNISLHRLVTGAEPGK